MALVHRVGWDPHFMQRNEWFWPLARAAARFERFADWPSARDYDALYQALAVPRGLPALRFADNVRKEEKKRRGRVVLGALYDGRIAGGEVPTRERDWHDFFNALCFATFPRAKRALHARQYAALRERIDGETERIPNARTKEQDALTLFDEGGAVIAADERAAAELSCSSGPERSALLLQLTEAGRARVVPFGHALFEHLVEGLRCPGGCTQIVGLAALPNDEDTLIDAVDVALAKALGDRSRFASPRDCSHLRLGELRGDARLESIHVVVENTSAPSTKV